MNIDLDLLEAIVLNLRKFLGDVKLNICPFEEQLEIARDQLILLKQLVSDEDIPLARSSNGELFFDPILLDPLGNPLQKMIRVNSPKILDSDPQDCLRLIDKCIEMLTALRSFSRERIKIAGLEVEVKLSDKTLRVSLLQELAHLREENEMLHNRYEELIVRSKEMQRHSRIYERRCKRVEAQRNEMRANALHLVDLIRNMIFQDITWMRATAGFLRLVETFEHETLRLFPLGESMSALQSRHECEICSVSTKFQPTKRSVVKLPLVGRMEEIEIYIHHYSEQQILQMIETYLKVVHSGHSLNSLIPGYEVQYNGN